MKKIFAFAIALVSMAAAMTSCNNDNDDFVAQKAPVAPKQEQTVNDSYSELKLYFPMLASQSEYIDEEVTVETVFGKETVCVYDLQNATDVPDGLKEAIESNKKLAGQYTYKVYTIKAGMKPGDEVKVTANASVKAPFTDFETSGVAMGVALKGESASTYYFSCPVGTCSMSNFHLGKYTADEFMNQMAKTISTVGTHTFTLK